MARLWPVSPAGPAQQSPAHLALCSNFVTAPFEASLKPLYHQLCTASQD